MYFFLDTQEPRSSRRDKEIRIERFMAQAVGSWRRR
jgi:hypothetical protein